MLARLRPLLSCLFLLLSAPLFANVTYTYTGNTFTDYSGNANFFSGASVNLSFTVASPVVCAVMCSIDPLTSVISAGGPSYSPPGDMFQSVSPSFQVQTDSLGNITAWNIRFNIHSIAPTDETIITTNNGDSAEYSVHVHIFTESLASNSTPGHWTPRFTAVPEPSTITLASIGACLALRRRKMKR